MSVDSGHSLGQPRSPGLYLRVAERKVPPHPIHWGSFVSNIALTCLPTAQGLLRTKGQTLSGGRGFSLLSRASHLGEGKNTALFISLGPKQQCYH